MRCRHPYTQAAPPRWYRGADVPRRLIRRFTREVADRFQPEKIILFGSYAYGQPHADSDVDILVIMSTRNELDQAVRICLTVEYNFPLDLLVRTPKNLAWRLAEGDSFIREVMDRGKVLYESPRNSGPAPAPVTAKKAPIARIAHFQLQDCTAVKSTC